MKYRAALFFSAFCLVFVSVFFVGRFVWADDQYGLKATATAADLVKETSVPTIIGNVIGAGLSLVTVLFFILMIYAGIKWMLARGDEGKAKEALDTIVAAIVGIVVVLAAYAITNFVFKSVGEQGSSGGPSTADNQNKDTAVAGTCSPKPFWEESAKCSNFLEQLKNGTATGQPIEDIVVDEDATCNNIGSLAYAPADVKAAQCVWNAGNCITQKAVDAKDFCGTVTDGPTCAENTDCIWN